MPASRTSRQSTPERTTSPAGPSVPQRARQRPRICRIKTGGRVVALKPTIVFDTFWRFAAERLAIDERRRQGLPPPWTDDPVLQANRFCTTFRILDRASQLLICKVIETGSQKPIDVVFRVVVFNLFTKIETYQLLDEALGPLTWARYNRTAYEQVLSRARDEGMTLYTSAFQKGAARMCNRNEAFRNHLRLLEAMMNGGLVEQILSAEYMDDIYAFIKSFPGMAEFTSYQLCLNLSYTSVINFSEMDFVVGGPGSRAGLSKCFGSSIVLPAMEVDVMRWMAETQDEHFARLGLTFNGLGPRGLPMGLADIEHTLCDADKYSRIAHPHIKSTWGPMRRRNPIMTSRRRGDFKPSSEPYPELRLPVAWAHPDRAIRRIRPGPPVRIDKRYVVERILEKRGEDGEEEYLIEWWGYSLDDATWEPAENIREDAPDVVEEYEGM